METKQMQPGRPRLRREIAVALAVKTGLLFGLWWLFFAQAPSKPDVARDIGSHLAGSGPWPGAAAGIADSSPTRSNNHDR